MEAILDSNILIKKYRKVKEAVLNFINTAFAIYLYFNFFNRLFISSGISASSSILLPVLGFGKLSL